VCIPAGESSATLQVCRSGLSSNRRIWLTRHGESEFNRKGFVGGDASLTDKGCQYAEALAQALCALVPVPDDKDELLPISCWTSTLRRTIQTAEHIPFPKLRWKALDEIHAGVPPGLLVSDDVSDRDTGRRHVDSSIYFRDMRPAGLILHQIMDLLPNQSWAWSAFSHMRCVN
jgi:hypothetical protein